MSKILHKLSYLVVPLAPVGVFLGSIGYISSFTPSLIPRDGLMQGVVAGLAFVIIYALFFIGLHLWKWLGFKTFHSKNLSYILYTLSIMIAIYGLSQGTQWQNSVYLAAGLEPVESIRPLTILGVSIVLVMILLGIGRLFSQVVQYISDMGERYLPKRVSLFISFLLIGSLFWSFGNGFLIQSIFTGIDKSSQQIDALMPVDEVAPTNPKASGSPDSLVSWKSLGSKGRTFVQETPSGEEIQKYSPNETVLEPLRVYIGMNSGDSISTRSQLALSELKRVDAFSKEILVIATPTGKGWIDPGSITPLEYLWRGDVATVSLQYSYLPSWLSLFADYKVGKDSAQELFATVYSYWKTLPEDARPRLYLNGLSLGSKHSETSSDVWDIIQDPYNGALWAGPTFSNELWKSFTSKREADSPYWSPRYQDDSLVRYYTQYGTQAKEDSHWDDFRIIYLQYPSDGITHFDMGSFLKKPDWMNEAHPPDISTQFRYIPVVTFLQLLTDNFLATSLQVGHGHNYAPRDYLRAWHDLTEPNNWVVDDYKQLEEYLTQK